MAAKLEFFWDVGSPYTYLASTQLAGLAERTGAELVSRPFLLGAVFKAVGNTMPAAVAAKAAYLLEDLARWRDWYRVPMRMPSTEVVFPINSLLPMRAAVAAVQAGAGEAFRAAALAAYWGEGRDVSQPEELDRVAASVGLDGGPLRAAAGSVAVKEELRANTDEAVRRGAFGAPALFVGEELYWGNDRLLFVEQRLRALAAG